MAAMASSMLDINLRSESVKLDMDRRDPKPRLAHKAFQAQPQRRKRTQHGGDRALGHGPSHQNAASTPTTTSSAPIAVSMGAKVGRIDRQCGPGWSAE